MHPTRQMCADLLPLYRRASAPRPPMRVHDCARHRRGTAAHRDTGSYKSKEKKKPERSGAVISGSLFFLLPTGLMVRSLSPCHVVMPGSIQFMLPSVHRHVSQA